MDKAIPYFKAPTQTLRDLSKEFNEILNSGILIKGKYNEIFEHELKSFLNVKNIVLVSSGTIGLTYLFKLLLEDMKNVYMPSFTFGATATTASWAGAENINFIDINSKKWTLDDSIIAENNIEKESIIVPVNLFGNPCDFDSIDSIAKKTKSKVIYDAAHSLGSEYKGNKVGSQGLAQVFSLSPTKVLTSGEGGIIATNNDDLAEQLRWMVEWGHKGDYNTILPGLNGRMSEIHALVGYESLLIIKNLLEKRNAQVSLYKETLNNEYFSFQEIQEDSKSTFKDFAIISTYIETKENRDNLINYLNASGINVKVYFDPPIHTHDFYKNHNFNNLKNTEEIKNKIICLPLFYSLEDKDILNISKKMNEYFD